MPTLTVLAAETMGKALTPVSISLISGLVLPTSHISTRLVSMNPAPQLWMSSKHQRLIDTSSDSDTDSVVHELPTGQGEEGKLSDLDQDISVTDTD